MMEVAVLLYPFLVGVDVLILLLCESGCLVISIGMIAVESADVAGGDKAR